MFAFLLSLFIVPSLALEVVSMVSCHQEKKSPLSVSEPPLLAGYLQPQRTARSCQCVEEVSGEWGFSWFKIWLPNDGIPETSIPWLSWAFLPSSTPGRKHGPARVDEELERLFGLSLSLQDEGGHRSMWSCPCQSIARLY